MKKKLISTIIAATLVASTFLLGACGGNDGDTAADTGNETVTEDETDDAAPPADDVEEPDDFETGTVGTINVGIWDSNQRPGLQQIADLFTEETGIPVEISVVPWGEYWTMLEAAAAGGDLPDVMWMHSNEIQRYMDNGMLMNLNDMIAASDLLDMSAFPAGLVELYQDNGNQYGIPKDIDTIALWYNIEMFDAAGVDTPTEDWTWEDFYEAAVALTDADNGIWGTSWAPGDNQVGYWNVIYSFGGYVINDAQDASGFDNPETIRAMEFTERLVRNAMPPVEIQAENEKSVLFGAGSIAMTTEGAWMIPAFKENEAFHENVGVAMLPVDAVTGRRASIENGLGWSVAANTDMAEEAMALVEWFGSEAMQRMQAELGVTMAAFEGVSDDWVNNTDLWDLTPYVELLDYAVQRPYSRNTTVWEFTINDMLMEVWAGTADLHETLDAIVVMMNDALANE
ncbi:MAG: sugar ABC transporter substrate-binding protein [Lachnospiraceae bacterium]|nr:sugar ABC transporter substrate-binding protein [Lachnospiraceae bacterium]